MMSSFLVVARTAPASEDGIQLSGVKRPCVLTVRIVREPALEAQREACEAYIRSQRHEGWMLTRTRFDDGGLLRRQYGTPGAASFARRHSSRPDRHCNRLQGRPADAIARRFCPAGRDL